MAKKKLKVGIVTLYGNENYGNRLQNYAVERVLKNLFKNSVVETLALEEGLPCKKWSLYSIKEGIAQKVCVHSPRRMVNKMNAQTIRMLSFKDWGEKNVSLRKIYNCRKIPDKYGAEYDCFVVGSDQVWNYNWSASPHFGDYFLDFTSRKKVAFSASIGVDTIEDNWKAFFCEKLKDFNGISVRETSAAIAIQELLNREIPVLVDPTMMLTAKDWCHVAKKPKVDTSKKYILRYFLGNDEESQALETFAQENGMVVYNLMDPANIDLYTSGPGEFISLIKNAALVCTDSFHCMVFSILFSTPFVAYNRKDAQQDMSSRIDTLLGKFNLLDRQVASLQKEEWLKCDYSQAEGILEKERQKVKEYLIKSIKL